MIVHLENLVAILSQVNRLHDAVVKKTGQTVIQRMLSMVLFSGIQLQTPVQLKEFAHFVLLS